MERNSTTFGAAVVPNWLRFWFHSHYRSTVCRIEGWSWHYWESVGNTWLCNLSSDINLCHQNDFTDAIETRKYLQDGPQLTFIIHYTFLWGKVDRIHEQLLDHVPWLFLFQTNARREREHEAFVSQPPSSGRMSARSHSSRPAENKRKECV